MKLLDDFFLKFWLSQLGSPQESQKEDGRTHVLEISRTGKWPKEDCRRKIAERF
jgi:hypothetical protein